MKRIEPGETRVFFYYNYQFSTRLEAFDWIDAVRLAVAVDHRTAAPLEFDGGLSRLLDGADRFTPNESIQWRVSALFIGDGHLQLYAVITTLKQGCVVSV